MADELHDFAGLYAVDALEGDELVAFELHLETCEQCRTEVAELREALTSLADMSAVAPPPSVRSAVLARITGMPQDPPVVTSLAARRDQAAAPDQGVTSAPVPAPARRSSRRWILAAAAVVVLVVAAVGIGIGVRNLSNRADDAEAIAALVASEDSQTVKLQGENHPPLNVVFSPGAKEAALLADGLDQVPADKTYELWAIRDGVPAKVTLFNSNADGELRSTFEGDLSNAQALAVTVEPAGGSPQPTTDIILSGSPPPPG